MTNYHKGGIMDNRYTFDELYLEQLYDLYSAEEQVYRSLPQYIDAVDSKELRATLNHYFLELEEHLTRLNSIFMEMRIKPSGQACDAVQGILLETHGIIQHGSRSPVKDAAIIAAVQRLQHYKMAVYGTARTYARHFNYNKSMIGLQKSLNEEGEADRQLTRLAEGGVFTTGINEEAYQMKSSI